MTIRSVLLMACVSLALLTGALGLFDRWTEQRIGRLAATIFDDAFLSMSYLRSAQNGFIQAIGECRAPPAACQGLSHHLADILADLKVAETRAPSEQSRVAAASLGDRLQGLGSGSEPELAVLPTAEIAPLIEAFDTAVELLAADGYHIRRRVTDIIADADRNNLVAVLLASGAAILIAVGLSATIIPPLYRAVALAEAVAAGKLDPPPLAHGRSETAILLRALRRLCTDLAALRVREAEAVRAKDEIVAMNAERTAHAVLAARYESTVGSAAAAMARTAEEQVQSVTMIHGQTMEAARGWSTIAHATRSMTLEARGVSNAAESLASATSAIDGQVQLGAAMARDAAAEVMQSGRRVQELAANTGRIAEVVRLIHRVANRTHLLALNAGIEAARAGAAGRGFAVVAGEVKLLAIQTAQATAEITRQISGVQQTTTEAVAAIDGIDGMIGRLAHVVGEVATTVSQQGHSTREIISRIVQVASDAAQVEQELDHLEKGHMVLDRTLAGLGTIIEQTTTRGQVIQQESEALLRGLRAA